MCLFSAAHDANVSPSHDLSLAPTLTTSLDPALYSSSSHRSTAPSLLSYFALHCSVVKLDMLTMGPASAEEDLLPSLLLLLPASVDPKESPMGPSSTPVLLRTCEPFGELLLLLPGIAGLDCLSDSEVGDRGCKILWVKGL